MLGRNTVFVTSPLDLNDPFEMRPAWTEDHEQRRFEDETSLAELTSGWPVITPSTDGKLEYVGTNERSVQPPVSVERQFGIADHHNQLVFSEFHRTYRILSLVDALFDVEDPWAESKDQHTLMWSHYADKFQGVCLGIDPSRLYYGLKKGGFRVSYLPTRETLNPDDYSIVPAITGMVKDEWSQFLAQIEFLTHKSPAWSYENEVRMIYELQTLLSHPSYRQIPDTPKIDGQEYRDAVYLPEDAITSVIFGAECLSKDIQSILAILSEGRYANVRVFCSAIHSSRFTVQYKSIAREKWNDFVRQHQEREKFIGWAKQHEENDFGSQKGKSYTPSASLTR